MENENILDPEVAGEETAAPSQEPSAAEQTVEEVAPAEANAEEAVPAEETPAAEAAEQEAPKPKGIRKLIRKWWFWAIIVALIALLVVGITLIADGGSSDASTSSNSSYYYEHPYVTLVKTTKNTSYGVTYGAAFNSFFTSPSWEYFSASSGEDVVEFSGGFLYDGAPATATVQFVLDMDAGMLEVYHLSINGVGQSRMMLSALLQKVFESY